MIGTVSDRIKNLIKLQDHNPGSQGKDREQSLESSCSGVKNLKTPKKIKDVSLVGSETKQYSQTKSNSNLNVFSNNNNNHCNDEELMEKVNECVLKIVYPLLTDINHKIDILT